jgi:hypothetical protein
MPADFFNDLVCPYCLKLTSFDFVNHLELASIKSRSGTATQTHRIEVQRFDCQNPRCRHSIAVLYKDKLPNRMLFPPPAAPKALSADTPTTISNAYTEASQCQAIGAMRAAGAMYRMALEFICDEQQIPRAGKNADGDSYHYLANRIGDLNSKGLPPDLVTYLHEVRLVGNDAVHQGIEYASDELDDIASLIEEAVEILWVQPLKRQTMAAARKARRDEAKETAKT